MDPRRYDAGRRLTKTAYSFGSNENPKYLCGGRNSAAEGVSERERVDPAEGRRRNSISRDGKKKAARAEKEGEGGKMRAPPGGSSLIIQKYRGAGEALARRPRGIDVAAERACVGVHNNIPACTGGSSDTIAPVLPFNPRKRNAIGAP